MSPTSTAWLETPLATYVASDSRGLGLGSHVCNCGYVVAPDAQGQGSASAMREHSPEQARSLGFRAMQFNLVVSTNQPTPHAMCEVA